ncbi:MAG: ABC transporter ATP-binding protein, partial [Pseudomonadota bacterium]
LIGGFTVILQAGVGFVLVSLYHPLFLVFNIVLILLIWGVWAIWGRGAVRSAIALSHKKHEAAAWLQGIAASNGYFKSDRHVAYALDRTDDATCDYVTQHRAHFRQFFSQTVSFLILYAAASAMLLGLGGWLVIQGQLSIGQLVAAELVLSAAFFGVSQLGTYLNYFYEFCAAVEELSLFDGIELEEPSGSLPPPVADSHLKFVEARGDARGRQAILDFDIPSGATIMGIAANYGVQRFMTNLIERHVEPRGGYVSLGGRDLLDTEVHALRREVTVLDKPMIAELTIREYLALAGADQNGRVNALEALRIVGLDLVVASLEDGLDTKLSPTGFPLSIVETMQLKLAAAIINRPRVLVLNQLFDLMPENCLKRSVDHLETDEAITVVYFSNRRRDLGFDAYFYLGAEKQILFDTFKTFEDDVYGGPSTTHAALVNEAEGIDPNDPIAIAARLDPPEDENEDVSSLIARATPFKVIND